MEITTTERYGVRIMADLAKNEGKVISIAEISERQDISIKYAEKIVALLKKAKLVKSTRGAAGGYKLTKAAKDISIREILNALGDRLELVGCISSNCDRQDRCESKEVWGKLNRMINDYLSGVSLSDIIC